MAYQNKGLDNWLTQFPVDILRIKVQTPTTPRLSTTYCDFTISKFNAAEFLVETTIILITPFQLSAPTLIDYISRTS